MTPLLACALASEERAARRAGARTFRVGLGASLGAPREPFVSFGLAGALVPGLAPGALVTAARVVDAAGRTLWEGEPVAVRSARTVVLCSAARVVDDPAERAALAAASGARGVDMETAALVESGRLVGVVRAISDSPSRRVGRLGRAAHPDGAVDWTAVALAFALEPWRAVPAASAGRKALGTLERAARELARDESA